MHVRLLLKTRATRGLSDFLLRPWFGWFEPSWEGVMGATDKLQMLTVTNYSQLECSYNKLN